MDLYFYLVTLLFYYLNQSLSLCYWYLRLVTKKCRRCLMQDISKTTLLIAFIFSHELSVHLNDLFICPETCLVIKLLYSITNWFCCCSFTVFNKIETSQHTYDFRHELTGYNSRHIHILKKVHSWHSQYKYKPWGTHRQYTMTIHWPI